MLKSLSKIITFIAGVLTMFVGGIIFIIMSDLTFKNNSGNLIIVVLLCFGSAIAFFFSNNFAEKPIVMYVLKGIGLALAIGSVIYFHLFSVSEFYLAEVERLRRYGAEKASEYAGALASVPVALVFCYLAVVTQASNIVLTAVLKDDVDSVPTQEQDAELAADGTVCDDSDANAAKE